MGIGGRGKEDGNEALPGSGTVILPGSCLFIISHSKTSEAAKSGKGGGGYVGREAGGGAIQINGRGYWFSSIYFYGRSIF